MRIKEKSVLTLDTSGHAMIRAIVEMKLTLERHLVMRIKDKSNCRDEVNARKTSGHAY